jgi:hypothetical protein
LQPISLAFKLFYTVSVFSLQLPEPRDGILLKLVFLGIPIEIFFERDIDRRDFFMYLYLFYINKNSKKLVEKLYLFSEVSNTLPNPSLETGEK